MTDAMQVVPLERIEQRIIVLRGQKVLLDSDLAELYGVETRVLNQAVSRNPDRFPEDFLFRLTESEFTECLKSQSVTSNEGRGGRRTLPHAFTEQGVAMLSSVLRSPRAVLVNIEIMRAFVHLRRTLATHQTLARKLAELERTYDARFAVVFDVLMELMKPPALPKSKGKHGFVAPDDG
jgi:hypothetical protein